MPTRLDEQQITDALTALPGWTGSTDRISRSVDLDDDLAASVTEAVSVTADAMNHHPDVERTGSTTSFTVWTHSSGGVTELDIVLASRISDILKLSGVRPPAAPDVAPDGVPAFGDDEEADPS